MYKFIKILFTSIVFSISTVKVNAHLNWTCKSDSTITYTSQNGVLTPQIKSISNYDFDGNILETISKGYNIGLNSWSNL